MELYVKDFALIDTVKVEFSRHFNVLSGETGAGKSIIIDAVSLLLGSRASVSDIRRGAEKAIIEGIFEASDDVSDALKVLGIEIADGEPLILRREISQNGKNICRINNIAVSLANFKEIGVRLVNIYGQHDYQEITKQERHLKLLDSLGDEAHQKQREVVGKCYHDLQICGRNLKKMLAKERDKKDRIEILRHKSKELDKLDKEYAEERMEQELQLLNNAAVLNQSSQNIEEILYQDSESVYNKLAQVRQILEGIRGYSQITEVLYKRVDSVVYEVEDIARAVLKLNQSVSENEERKNELEEKLYLIQRLKRRYGMSLEELLDEKAAIEQELAQLENLDQAIIEIKREYGILKQKFIEQGKILSIMRKDLADRFAALLVAELNDLAMPNCRFTVAFTEELSAEGLDKGEFLFSANKGEELKPLRQIASGGEMSRIMLAFKRILAEKNNYAALIFDEVDTGIGGNVVMKVAQKLKDVSRNAQVICVTHAPQIAALADSHYLIRKTEVGERTVSEVSKLEDEERISEIARMLGGKETYQINAAKEMLREK